MENGWLSVRHLCVCLSYRGFSAQGYCGLGRWLVAHTPVSVCLSLSVSQSVSLFFWSVRTRLPISPSQAHMQHLFKLLAVCVCVCDPSPSTGLSSPLTCRTVPVLKDTLYPSILFLSLPLSLFCFISFPGFVLSSLPQIIWE